MNTLLPPTFIFNRANSLYPKTIKQPFSYNNINDLEKIIFATIFILAIMDIVHQLEDYYVKKHPDRLDPYDNGNIVTGFLDFIEIALVFVNLAILIIWPSWSTSHYNNQVNNYNTAGFKITNTNLIALSEKNDSINDIKDKIEPNKNVKQNHYEVYVNPDKQKPVAHNYLDVYLGKMTNGKFKPNNNQLGRTFAAYQQYIKKHHLENHFKKKMLLIDSDKYATIDQSIAYVLVGDDDYTLHFKNAKPINQKTIDNNITAN